MRSWSRRGVGVASLGAIATACSLLELPPREELAAPGVTALVTSLPAPYGLAVDDTSIYWSDANGVHAASKLDGSGRRDLYATEAGTGLGEVAANASGVYWIEGADDGGAQIGRWLDGGTSWLPFAGTTADHLTAAGASAFASAGARGAIISLPDLTPLDAASPASPGALWIATDGNHLAEVTAGGHPSLKPLDGGKFTQAPTHPDALAAGPIATVNGLLFIATTNGGLAEYAQHTGGPYFSSSFPSIGPVTSIALMPVPLGSPVTLFATLQDGGVISTQTPDAGLRTLASSGSSARAVCADESAAYWIELDSDGTGKILRWTDKPD